MNEFDFHPLFSNGREMLYPYDLEKVYPGEGYTPVSLSFIEKVCHEECVKKDQDKKHKGIPAHLCKNKKMEDGERALIVSSMCPFHLLALCSFPEGKRKFLDG